MDHLFYFVNVKLIAVPATGFVNLVGYLVSGVDKAILVWKEIYLIRGVLWNVRVASFWLVFVTVQNIFKVERFQEGSHSAGKSFRNHYRSKEEAMPDASVVKVSTYFTYRQIYCS